jgi:hypothetical protein
VGERLCRTPEEFKAWSQNLGHSAVLTTFSAYGNVSEHRTAAIIKELGKEPATAELGSELAELLRKHKVSV